MSSVYFLHILILDLQTHTCSQDRRKNCHQSVSAPVLPTIPAVWHHQLHVCTAVSLQGPTALSLPTCPHTHTHTHHTHHTHTPHTHTHTHTTHTHTHTLTRTHTHLHFLPPLSVCVCVYSSALSAWLSVQKLWGPLMEVFFCPVKFNSSLFNMRAWPVFMLNTWIIPQIVCCCFTLREQMHYFHLLDRTTPKTSCFNYLHISLK